MAKQRKKFNPAKSFELSCRRLLRQVWLCDSCCMLKVQVANTHHVPGVSDKRIADRVMKQVLQEDITNKLQPWRAWMATFHTDGDAIWVESIIDGDFGMSNIDTFSDALSAKVIDMVNNADRDTYCGWAWSAVAAESIDLEGMEPKFIQYFTDKGIMDVEANRECVRLRKLNKLSSKDSQDANR